jgi:hypothetical protein
MAAVGSNPKPSGLLAVVWQKLSAITHVAFSSQETFGNVFFKTMSRYELRRLSCNLTRASAQWGYTIPREFLLSLARI